MKMKTLVITITNFSGEKISGEIKVQKLWKCVSKKDFWPEYLLIKISTDWQKSICFSCYQNYFYIYIICI